MDDQKKRTLVVVMKAGAGLRAGGATLASAAGADVSGLQSILSQYGATLRSPFGDSEETLLGKAGTQAEGAPVSAPDLSKFYQVDAEDSKLEALQQSLLSDPLIDGAYITEAGEPPTAGGSTVNQMQPAGAAPPATTPDFSLRQGYLDPAPDGVDARYAWTVSGGGGNGVNIIDCEWNWNLTHEDLTAMSGAAGGTPNGDVNHGTAVIGTFHGDRNALGVTGIAPESTARVYAFDASASDSAAVIYAAADMLADCDIMLLEIHRPGPAADASKGPQFGYIAIEWWPLDFAAIQYAASKNIIVVEAAGNGAQNLDDPIYDTPLTGFPSDWSNPFNRSNRDSGAIVVGAGAPPAGTHGNDYGPDRSRLDFSNFGAVVDVQGWGREVTTTGYGDLQGGSANQQYTDQFSGTSSASPIVVGSIACVQGALKQSGNPRLTPKTARDLLRATGSPQQDAPTRPATERIGNRPDIKEMMTNLGLSASATPSSSSNGASSDSSSSDGSSGDGSSSDGSSSDGSPIDGSAIDTSSSDSSSSA
jgi:hypothetical protein